MSKPERQPHAVLDLPSRRWKGEKILRVLQLGPRPTPWRILEVGTGSGGIAHYLGTHPTLRCDVTSVDVVDLRRVEGGYRFLRVKGTALPFPDGAFDVVISNHVIEHVGCQEAQLDHLGECRRVLAADGRGYLAVPNRWMLVEPHYRLALLSWWPRRWRSAWLRLWRRGTAYDCEPLTMPDLEALLREAGLQYANVTVQALRETLAIEGAHRWSTRVAARVPDALWRGMRRWIPTLIYRFGRAGADSAARSVPTL